MYSYYGGGCLDKYNEIEIKYKILINKAIDIVNDITDYEHNINHTLDVVDFTKELLDKLNIDVDKDVCIIAAYWHDTGRIKLDKGHEKLSADMLKDEMLKYDYDITFIDKCYKAIINHKWNMIPETNEGLVIKDADKLAFLGRRRWIECLKHNYRLDSIISLLSKLKDEILYFSESKKIYDRLIIELVNLLYNEVFNGNN